MTPPKLPGAARCRHRPLLVCRVDALRNTGVDCLLLPGTGGRCKGPGWSRIWGRAAECTCPPPANGHMAGHRCLTLGLGALREDRGTCLSGSAKPLDSPLSSDL